MKCFDNFITEDEIKNIKKKDNLFTVNVISLDDKNNTKFLNSYAYQEYLKKQNNSEVPEDE